MSSYSVNYLIMDILKKSYSRISWKTLWKYHSALQLQENCWKDVYVFNKRIGGDGQMSISVFLELGWWRKTVNKEIIKDYFTKKIKFSRKLRKEKMIIFLTTNPFKIYTLKVIQKSASITIMCNNKNSVQALIKETKTNPSKSWNQETK